MEKAGNSMTSHDMAKQILLKSFYFRQFPFISKKNFSPVKSRDDHLFPCFSKKRHGKTHHVMELPAIPTEKSGQREGG